MKVKILPKEKCLSISKAIYKEEYKITDTPSNIILLFAIPDEVFNKCWEVAEIITEHIILENLYSIPFYFIDWSAYDEN